MLEAQAAATGRSPGQEHSHGTSGPCTGSESLAEKGHPSMQEQGEDGSPLETQMNAAKPEPEPEPEPRTGSQRRTGGILAAACQPLEVGFGCVAWEHTLLQGVVRVEG